MVRFIRAFALLIITPLLARAQDSAVVGPGARVRAYIVPPGTWRAGTLEHISRDTLVLRSARCSGCALEFVPRPNVTQLEVSDGRSGYQLRGMGLGLVAGAAIGAFVIAPCPHGNAASDGPPCGLGQGIAALYGGIGGLFIGGVVGAVWPSRERWRPVQWP